MWPLRACGGYSGLVWMTIAAAVTLPGRRTRLGGLFEGIGMSGADSPKFPLGASWFGEGPGPVEAPATGWTWLSVDCRSGDMARANPTENRQAALSKDEI